MKQLAADECRWSSQQLQAFNEAPTDDSGNCHASYIQK